MSIGVVAVGADYFTCPCHSIALRAPPPIQVNRYGRHFHVTEMYRKK